MKFVKSSSFQVGNFSQGAKISHTLKSPILHQFETKKLCCVLTEALKISNRNSIAFLNNYFHNLEEPSQKNKIFNFLSYRPYIYVCWARYTLCVLFRMYPIKIILFMES